MTTYLNKPELLMEIGTTLTTAIDPTFASRAASWDLYEVYVFSLVVEEAGQAGANVTFRDGKDRLTSSLIFRISPSSISSNDSFTHARLEFQEKRPLEVHVGIYASEKSTERTECDVCVIDKSEADFFRNRRVRQSRSKGLIRWPEGTKIALAIECKYLVSDLGAAKSREFVGLCTLLGAKHFHLVTNTTSKAAGHRVQSGPGESVWQHDVIPPSISSLNRFRGVLKQRFDSYQTTAGNSL